MNRMYPYVGPAEIASAVADIHPGFALRKLEDVFTWLKQNRSDFDRSGRITQTFVVAEDGYIRLADRHSEHVACAGGLPVLAAGEISLKLLGTSVFVEEVTNQSTGYCPEPESWQAVSTALALVGIENPGEYTTAYVFRKCEQCGQINLVKDEIFECAVCASSLPTEWNFGR